MIKLRNLLNLSLLVLAASANAQVVECVDANGKKTYAQSCPDDAAKKREIEVQPKLGGSKTPDDSWKDKEKEFEKRRQDRLKAEAKDADQQKKSAQAGQRCSDARQHLELLESGKQSKRVDADTGQHVPMDGDDRQNELNKLHAEIQDYCQ